jgi:L-aspartate oxidase
MPGLRRGFTNTAVRRARQAKAEVLVLGSGIAGSAAALSAAERGLQVTLVSSATKLSDCNSQWAQGGIIYKGLNDTPSLLGKDIHIAGAGRCKPQAVKILSEEGPSAVESLLLENGAQFDRNASGDLALCLEGGHGLHRIVHWGDRTGAEIIRCLHGAVAEHPKINVESGLLIHKLVVDGGMCVGADGVDQNGVGVSVSAGETVLATGGIGEIYGRTSNPKSARGDGIGMAIRAGTEVADMEFVQFHPTTLAIGPTNFLISEAVRGEGAKLVNAEGEQFALRYDARGELAPRDIVARMIFGETARTGVVYLDCRHLGSEFLEMRFPSIFEHCASMGLDMGKDLLPVTPAQHFICGGVATNEHAKTSVKRLLAVGEAACSGVHGANRLASTSLLEGLVYGRRAAEALECHTPPALRTDAVSPVVQEVPESWIKLQECMWANVGIMRSSEKMENASARLLALEEEAEADCAPDRCTTGALSFRNAVATAKAILTAAKSNGKSVGTHFREDACEELP